MTTAVLSLPAMAQLGGGKTTTIVVPFSASGPTDFIARLLAEPLAKELGMPVIIDNRPGASGNIGTKRVVDSNPDGLTLVHSTAAMQAVNPLMYPDAGFEPSQDLIPVGITGALPNILVVHPESGIKTVEALVKKGTQPGGDLSFATFGPGSSPHFFGSLLKKTANITSVPIAYKGSGSASTDMLAGRIDFMFDSMTTSLPQVKAGKLVPLAITSSKRSPLLPEVPTLKETGYGDVDVNFWFTLQVPASTPPEIVAKLRQAIDKAVQDPKYRQSVAARGVENFYVAPSDLDAFVKSDTKKWRETALSIGIKPE
jgi:tripartite-type tricarboxylate transporter receptor subunit TctC